MPFSPHAISPPVDIIFGKSFNSRFFRARKGEREVGEVLKGRGEGEGVIQKNKSIMLKDLEYKTIN